MQLEILRRTLRVHPLCHTSLSHKGADPHTSENFLVVCGSASVFATRKQRGAVVRCDAKPCGNTGKYIARARRSSPGSSCGPLLYLLRPSSHPLPGPAPGCRPADRLFFYRPATSSFVTFHSSLEKKESNDHGLACHKWNKSYISVTYGLSVWARNRVGKYVSVMMRVRRIVRKNFLITMRVRRCMRQKKSIAPAPARSAQSVFSCTCARSGCAETSATGDEKFFPFRARKKQSGGCPALLFMVCELISRRRGLRCLL